MERQSSLVLVSFLLVACAPRAKVEVTPAEELKPIVIKVNPEKEKQKENVRVKEKLRLIDIISSEGVPTDNFWPASKKQVSIYKKEDKWFAYYFVKNILVSKTDTKIGS